MAFADPGTRNVIAAPLGPASPTITLASACKEGDVLGYSSGWKQALATTGGVIQARVVALKPGAIGDVIPVSPTAVVSGYTGGTAGNPVYVAEGTSVGCITETAPSTSGDANIIIGYMLNATDALIMCNIRADATA
jgi:hypothetical protein